MGSGKKKWLSLLLVVCLVLTAWPAHAAGGNDEHVDMTHDSAAQDEQNNSTATAIDVDDLMPMAWTRYQQAAALHELGLFDGVSASMFNPGFDAPLTREQAMKVILQTLRIQTDMSAQSRFSDVSPWAQPYVARAHAMGITSGKSATSFDGAAPVTVRELLTFYLRAMGEDPAAAWQQTFMLAQAQGLMDSLAGSNQESLALEATRETLVAVACDAMQQLAREKVRNLPDGGGAEDEDVVLWSLMALQNADFDRLSALVHPTKGALFSADPQIEEAWCTHVMPDTLKRVFEADSPLLWGVSGITGEPIELSVQAYLAQHINRVNYRESHVGVQYGLVTARGNAPLNYREFFPEATAVEFFYPGTRAVEGKDFSSLILLFETYEGRVYLVGVLSNYWMV